MNMTGELKRFEKSIPLLRLEALLRNLSGMASLVDLFARLLMTDSLDTAGISIWVV